MKFMVFVFSIMVFGLVALVSNNPSQETYAREIEFIIKTKNAANHSPSIEE
jgi:hypothetical protein